MTKLPYVSSEGGPLLIGDANALRNWCGAFGDGSDYNRACQIVRDKRVGCLNDRILVWDIEGAGTAFLTHHDDRAFHLVRFWADEETTDDTIRGMIRQTNGTGERTSVQIASSPAIILWACEETTSMIISAAEIPAVPTGDWSMGGTVYCFPVTPGHYVAEVGHCETESLVILSLTCRLADAEGLGEPS